MIVSDSDGAAVAAEAATRLQTLPDEARRFSATAEHAARAYGLDLGVLDHALRAGLSCRDNGTLRDTWVDPYDVHFIATRVAARRHRGGQAGELNATVTPVRVEYRIRRQRQLTGTALCSVLTLNQNRTEIAIDASTSVLWRGIVTQRGYVEAGRVIIPDTARAILARAAEIEHRFMPPEARGNADLVRTAGIGDCTTVAALVCEELTNAGVTARPAYGLLLAEPMSSTHSWIELWVGDTWLPVDPVMQGLARRYRPGAAGLDVSQPIRGRVCRLTSEPAPIVVMSGQPLPVSFPSATGQTTGQISESA